ncbi:MAG: cell wall hydrolase, partial [Hyphomicrobiales bacterium]|nr:cell wall hydrolase [Hyphomicrobiales bacterium]
PELSARLGGGRSAPGGSGTGADSAGVRNMQSLQFGDGATPAVPAAEALATATPAIESDLPIMAGPAPGAPAAAVAATKPAAVPAKSGTTVALAAHPDFAALIAPRLMARETYCLAEAVYFESRSEPVAGQAAVAQVVLNRLRSGLYPRSVCGVVFQNANVYLGCQFTFACEGKKLAILEPAAWALANRIAKAAIAGANYNPVVGDAVNYHANYVRPYWARYMRLKDRIGHHIFYANPG